MRPNTRSVRPRSGFEHIAIAATAPAAAHSLTALTAHEREFEPLGMPLANSLKLPTIR